MISLSSIVGRFKVRAAELRAHFQSASPNVRSSENRQISEGTVSAFEPPQPPKPVSEANASFEAAQTAQVSTGSPVGPAKPRQVVHFNSNGNTTSRTLGHMNRASLPFNASERRSLTLTEGDVLRVVDTRLAGMTMVGEKGRPSKVRHVELVVDRGNGRQSTRHLVSSVGLNLEKITASPRKRLEAMRLQERQKGSNFNPELPKTISRGTELPIDSKLAGRELKAWLRVTLADGSKFDLKDSAITAEVRQAPMELGTQPRSRLEYLVTDWVKARHPGFREGDQLLEATMTAELPRTGQGVRIRLPSINEQAPAFTPIPAGEQVVGKTLEFRVRRHGEEISLAPILMKDELAFAQKTGAISWPKV